MVTFKCSTNLYYIFFYPILLPNPPVTWWRHQMETFSALLAICAGNTPVPGEFPTQRLVTRSFDVFFDLRLNKWLNKQSWGWWFETLPCPLWRHGNEIIQCTGGHRTRVAAVTLDNMAETRSPLRKIYRKFSPCLFVTAAQLLWVDCQCYGTHWRGIPSCSDSASHHNSGLKFRVVTRVSVVSVFPETRVSVSPDEGTAVYKWT